MTTGQIVGTPDTVRRVPAGKRVGLVPTMGSLHNGHLALIERAAAENEVAAISIFVNPAQFNDPVDLAAYPRALESDAELAIGAGAQVIYVPAVETVYPTGFSTAIEVSGLTERWEGAARRGDFAGVATVVSILLNTVRPDRSYFGEKNFQQLAVIRRMHRDLRLPGEIIECPTIRDRDGLAFGSRNSRLSDDGRLAAAALPEALFTMRDMSLSGVNDINLLIAAGQRTLFRYPAILLDYLAVVNSQTLEPVEGVIPGSRALVAVQIGSVRLIDNISLGDA